MSSRGIDDQEEEEEPEQQEGAEGEYPDDELGDDPSAFAGRDAPSGFGAGRAAPSGSAAVASGKLNAPAAAESPAATAAAAAAAQRKAETEQRAKEMAELKKSPLLTAYKREQKAIGQRAFDPLYNTAMVPEVLQYQPQYNTAVQQGVAPAGMPLQSDPFGFMQGGHPYQSEHLGHIVIVVFMAVVACVAMCCLSVVVKRNNSSKAQYYDEELPRHKTRAHQRRAY